MAFDTQTRNRLNAFVGEARRLITREFTEKFQSLYGISAEGGFTDLAALGHLDEAQLGTAALLRSRIDYLVRSHPDDKGGVTTAIARVAREQAFTVLNRLAALRMAEKRGLIVESVGGGYRSKGFQVFERVAGSALGDSYLRYRRYLFCLFDELAVDLGALFDRRSPQGILFPREPALLALLELLNAPDLEELWAEDETIGWIYQYYNDEAERTQMRKESSAPRNSRELAVRNQFFTPRYVVEFLTDNTLGRIWYEMRHGQTQLKEQCRYLVRRPTEIFLKVEEPTPEPAEANGNLSQEELLRLPVHIPHRPLKDPREIRLLDPACGSMHFGLYAFDLFTVIYDEAWEIAHGPDDAAKSAETFAPFVPIAVSFPDKGAFLREVPRLIVEHNIHGIDIDPRAAQIAGLSLWLRAQRAWHQAGVKPADRPRITRSNLVCAEPMPGEKELLREFVEQQFPAGERPAFAFLLDKVFDRMTLAGEAGSLLRIEEEIRAAIAEARALAQQQAAPRQTALWAGDERPEQAEFDLRGLNDEQFWQAAEHRIYDALEAYAEQAENGGGFQRRLFADDAAQGFAFINLCRKRYDVVVMNPPFGAMTSAVQDYATPIYPNSKNDIATCFIDRCLTSLDPMGALGAITNRTSYFSTNQENYRRNLILPAVKHITFCDLGSGVLDAMVETAAYVFRKTPIQTHSIFIKATKEDNKGLFIATTIANFLIGQICQKSFVRDLGIFSKIPGATFSYWISVDILGLFRTWDAIESGPETRTARSGIQTSDDFRFLRLWWEVPSTSLLDSRSTHSKDYLSYEFINWCRERTFSGKSWVPLAKGGEYLPFYSNLHLTINWANDGKELKAWADPLYDWSGWSRIIKSTEYYFHPGVTWTQRTTSDFSARVLPAGSIFGVKGPTLFCQQDWLLPFLGYLNSALFQELLDIFVGASDAAARSYDNGIVQILPNLSSKLKAHREQILDAYDYYRRLCLPYETCIEFHCPFLKEGSSITRKITEIDLALGVAPARSKQPVPKHEFASEETEHSPVDLSYCLGLAFGRWDIRYATGEKGAPELPDPFAPLPVCPPGMLQGDAGLPLSPEAGRRLRTEGRYPLDVAWEGILVDDPEHPLDLERRVHAALAVLLGDRVDALEYEACALLGVPTLREWFRRPAGFFADHLKRYSKSRRQAPIYWPLSTASGSYTLWIYYHRLSDQTLHTAIADFIDPKLKSIDHEISAQREKPGGGGSKAAELLEFRGELLDLKAELERIIKLPWKPNLNDGVLITACPLWKLFRLPKWQKDLKTCWQELEKGDYDWAHLAYSIWPRRVEELCKTDRSIAIAHNLEHLCKVEPPKPKKERKTKQPAAEGGDPQLEGLEEPDSPAPSKSVAPPPKATVSKPKAAAREPKLDTEAAARIDIEDTDRDEVMCRIRQLFGEGGPRERDTALKQLSLSLGYQRLGTKVREILERDLLTAVRRGILANESGQLRLAADSVEQVSRDELKDEFLAAIGRVWMDREDAVRSFARFLGYARTGPVLEETSRSLINGLIREGRLEANGAKLRRT